MWPRAKKDVALHWDHANAPSSETKPNLYRHFTNKVLCLPQPVSRSCLSWCDGNVPVKSKLKHPPGHLTSIAAREGGNLMTLVFPRAGHLITTHRGWGIWSLASISYYVALIPGGVINHDRDKPWCIQSERYPIRGGLAEKERLAQALLSIWRYSRTICIIFSI